MRLDGFGGPGARLVARSGNILHEWKASREQGVTFGALAESPRSHGASRIAILGNGIQPGLCAFDADHPDRLLWSSGSDLEHFRVPALPTSSGVAVHSPFFVQFGLLVDIFPDSPGSEVLAIHNDKLGDGAVIRIYNLEGTVLYEAWHSGFLYSAYWMTEPGLLVLAGVNSQALWRDRGHPEVHAVAWPAVVMAIRPVRGEKRGWITTPTLAGEFSPEWYRCVLPPGAVSEEKVALRAPDAGMGDPERIVCLGLNTDSVGLFLDGAGRMQRKPLVMATRRQSPGDGPSDSLVEQITLGDLPPIIRTVPGSPPPKGK